MVSRNMSPSRKTSPKPKRRFSTNEEEMIRDAVQKGVPVMEVATTVGVSKATIYSVCHSLRLAERASPSKRIRR